jgi:hypothetical protein
LSKIILNHCPVACQKKHAAKVWNMAAEVCLLLMQSLTGDCDAKAIAPPDRPPSTVMPSAREMTGTSVMLIALVDTIAPVAAQTLPQFGELCQGDEAQQLAICALPGWRGTGHHRRLLMPVKRCTDAVELANDATTDARPRRCNRPVSARRRPWPLVANHRQPPPRYAVRPSNGSELFRQRQVALQSGQSYTRIAPSAYANQWQIVGRQPTYEDWKQLLAQEARAMAGGQGQNRLEVIVGDSLGCGCRRKCCPAIASGSIRAFRGYDGRDFAAGQRVC